MIKFDYLKPRTVDELLVLLDKHGDDAKLLAGGSDLIVLMRAKIAQPKYLIDLKGIKELHEISYDEKKGLRIGATVTMAQILESEVVKTRFGVLWSAVEVLADPVLRNRGTLVGNICNASPAADAPPALLVLGAEVEIVGKGGERVVPVKEFFTGVKRTSLKPGEFVRAVRIPNPPEGTKGKYFKWGRTHGEDLSVVGLAVLVTDSKIARVALSSSAPTPLLVPEVEEIFKGDGPLEKKIEDAALAVQKKICPISDVRCCKEYRVHMAGVLTRRGLKELLGVGG